MIFLINYDGGPHMKIAISMISLFIALWLFAISLSYIPEIQQAYIFVVILGSALCILSYGAGKHFHNSIFALTLTPTCAILIIMYKLHQIDINDKLGWSFISFLSFAVGGFCFWLFLWGATKPTVINEKQFPKEPNDDSN